MCHGVSLKSTLLESDHVSRRRREKPFVLPHVRLHGVMSPAGGTQVLLSGASANCLPPHFAQIHYLGKGERRGKLLIKDVPTLWLLQAVCRHLEPAVSSPLKEREGEGEEGWKPGNILISRLRNSTSWQQTRLPRNNEGEREWGGAGGGKEAGRKQHTRTHLKIYLHILCTRWANIWCLVVIGVYKAFVGFCFVFLCFVLPLAFFPVEERWDTSCQLKGKGGVSFAHLPEVWSPTQND